MSSSAVYRIQSALLPIEHDYLGIYQTRSILFANGRSQFDASPNAFAKQEENTNDDKIVIKNSFRFIFQCCLFYD